MVTKEDWIQIQITSEIKEEFEKAAEYQGLKPAAFLHSLIVGAINDSKKENSETFKSEIPVLTLEEAIADDERKRAENKMPPK